MAIQRPVTWWKEPHISGLLFFSSCTDTVVIYWTLENGAREVHGAIRDTWANMGWERSQLGYPVSDESGPSDRRWSNFQGGILTGTPTGGVVLSHRIDDG